MDRVIKDKIEESPVRLTGSSRLNNEIKKYLDDPRLQEIYKIAIDIKSSFCYFHEGKGILNCAIPIYDEPKFSIYDYIQIRTTVPEKTPIEIYPPSHLHMWDKTLTNADELRKDLKYIITRELEEEFGKNINFQILKEYLEEEKL